MKTTGKKIFILLSVLLPLLFLTSCRGPVADSVKYGSYTVPVEFLEDTARVVEDNNSYIAHPDTVRLKNGKILLAYVNGHGKGPLTLRESLDNGATWSEKLSTPASWENSQETPTLYRLQFQNGSEKIVLITGRPGWKGGAGGEGFDMSVADENGENWTEFERFYDSGYVPPSDAKNKWKYKENQGYPAIVAMASLTRLQDGSGSYIDQWMGIFHDYEFVNYKTFLTFDESGKAFWTAPVRLFDEGKREKEKEYNLCEIETVRSPDGATLLLLMRANAHKTPSVMAYSTDEGETWQGFFELPSELTGDRHKAEFDPVSGKLIVTFRQLYQKRKNKYAAGDWIAWIGNFEDILTFADIDPANDRYGDKIVRFGKSYDGGDCGYAGITASEEGRFSLVSYGHFKEDSEAYIVSVQYSVNK